MKIKGSPSTTFVTPSLNSKNNYFKRYNLRISKRLKRESGAGFTLIELVVAITVITVFLAVVISNFSQIKLQFSLSRVSYKFAQDLRRAQNMTLAGVPYKDSMGVEQPIAGYGVYIDMGDIGLGSKKYILYADKKIGNQEYDAVDYTFETIDFSLNEPGIVIKEIRNGAVLFTKVSVNFSPPNPNTTIMPSNQSKVDITFALSSDLTKSRTVSVNKSGLIEVK